MKCHAVNSLPSELPHMLSGWLVSLVRRRKLFQGLCLSARCR